MKNEVKFVNYLSTELYFLKVRESALNLIIKLNFDDKLIKQNIIKAKNQLLNMKKSNLEKYIRGKREFIYELETGLLLVGLLRKYHNGNLDNIKYAFYYRKNNYLVRRDAYLYASHHQYNIKIINSKIDEMIKTTKAIFPGENYPNREEMGPVLYNKEYILSLREIIMLRKYFGLVNKKNI